MKTNANSLLTNASSVPIVLYGRKRQRGKRVAKKPYEVEYKGVTIRCDTPQEAVEVARLLGGEPDHPHFAPWRVDEFTEFVQRIHFAQRRLLSILMKAKGQAVKDAQLSSMMGVSGNQALAGILSGVTKIAKAMDLEPSRIYYQRTEYNQGSPERRYYITPAFLKAAEDVSWPSPIDLIEREDD
jgi:hypothetical protein